MPWGYLCANKQLIDKDHNQQQITYQFGKTPEEHVLFVVRKHNSITKRKSVGMQHVSVRFVKSFSIEQLKRIVSKSGMMRNAVSFKLIKESRTSFPSAEFFLS